MFLSDFSLADVQVLDSYSSSLCQKILDFMGKFNPDRLLYNFRIAAGFSDDGENSTSATTVGVTSTAGVTAPTDVATSTLKVFGPYPNWENSKIGGHTMGHYLAAAAQAVNHGYGDVKGSDGRTMAQRLNYIIGELEKCQTFYANHHPDQKGFIFGALLEKNQAAPWQFDKLEEGKSIETWVPWYTMHKILNGLIEVYKLTQNHKALEIAQELGQWIYRRVSKWSEELKYKILEVEYGGMNDCLYELYKVSKNDGYNDFQNFALAAQQFDEDRLFELVASGSENPLDNKHANCTIPKFMGALNRYLALDQEKYLFYAERFWDLVVNHHTYITGGNSECEHFGKDDILDAERSNTNCETCNTHNMLKLTRQLFKITCQKKYADYYEQTYINAILASMNNQTGMTTYFQPMTTGCFKVYCNPDLEKNFFWCCTGTGLENFTKLGDSFYFHTENQLFTTIYISSQVEWKEKGFSLVQTADLEKSGKVTFEITKVGSKSSDQKIELLFRKPDWSSSFEVKTRADCNHKSLDSGFESLTASWQVGDKITIQLNPKLQTFTLPDNNEVFALKYGPYVLAAELGKDDDMAIHQIGIQCDVCANKIVNGEKQDLPGQYFSTSGIGCLTDEKLKTDFSREDFFENPGRYLVKDDGDVAVEEGNLHALEGNLTVPESNPPTPEQNPPVLQKSQNPLSFYLKAENWEKTLHFVPYYKLHNQRYGIYWKI